MGSKLSVVHYLNQFFGQIGAEARAGTPPLAKDGPIGPGRLFQEIFGRAAEIKGTVICGDNYFNEHFETAKAEVIRFINGCHPDLVIAGPAFNSGRYGVACGEVCQTVAEHLTIPAVTGMFPDNPGVDLYKKSIYIIETKPSSIGMQEAAEKMVAFGIKLTKQESKGKSSESDRIHRTSIFSGFAKHTYSESGTGPGPITFLVIIRSWILLIDVK